MQRQNNFTNKKLTGSPINSEDEEYIKSLIITETPQYLVINKPSGLAVQSGSGVEKCVESLLIGITKNSRKRPKLVHRIDRETSGILIVAKNRTTAAFLSEQFANKTAQKTYYAIVSGQTPTKGTIDVPLKRVKVNNIDISQIASPKDKNAQHSLTHFETVKTVGNISLLELMPKTGRMHQLRAHLAHIGHPILGDLKYGGLLSANAKPVKRLMLHAQKLIIDCGSSVNTFECPIPDDMLEILK